ncbi:MAG: hypothetical protein C5B57_03600, partial [Blastocatellia bacterium]
MGIVSGTVRNAGVRKWALDWNDQGRSGDVTDRFTPVGPRQRGARISHNGVRSSCRRQDRECC